MKKLSYSHYMIDLAANESETVQYAQKLAARLAPGDIVFLRGDLGAGKTVFARALIRSLTGNEDLDVPSPTFTLVQTYDTGKGPVWHFDLYRIEEPEEIYELGWEEALDDGIMLVEWPERLGHLAPPGVITVNLKPVAGHPDHRHILLEQEI